MSISLKREGSTQSTPQLNSWLLGILLSLLILGLGFLAYYQFITVPQTLARNKIQTAAVQRKTLPITISANGTVQPQQSVNVSPKSSGILKKLLVKEGDTVKAGQILAYMDDSNLQGQFHQAQANLAVAQANLRKTVAGNRQQDIAQAKARLQDAQFALRQTEEDWQRNQSLFEAGAVSQQLANSARTARDRAEAQVQQLQEALGLAQAGARTEDIDQACAQVAAAAGALQIIQTSINDTVIRAPYGVWSDANLPILALL